MAKPLASALILVFMIQVIAGPSGQMLRGFVIVGSALWSLVLSGIAGLAWAVLDDRERYRMLKYVYVSPSSFVVVLLGRGIARLAVGAMGAAITLAVGVVFLGVSFSLAAVDWPLLVITAASGLVAILALGVMMAAICIQTRQDSWTYPEAVAGALFLVVGAVFPLSALPSALQVIGLLNPLTWWIAGVRQALFPGGPSSIGGARLGLVPGLGGAESERRPDRHCLAGHGSRRYTRSGDPVPRQRASGEGSRHDRPNDRILTGQGDECGSTRGPRARTSKRSSVRSEPSSTSAGCARSCWPRLPTASSSRAWS